MPYSDEYEAKKSIPIVQVATGHTTACSRRYILIFNEALHILELTSLLMNPNQLRHYGLNEQDNPCSSEPMIIEKSDDDEEFITCLKSDGINIFLDAWTPSDKDLDEYAKIAMTLPLPWEPREIVCPGTDQTYIDEIESRNMSSMEINFMGEDDLISYDDPHCQSVRIFDIRSFNRRIMKLLVIDARVSNGPLTEDQLMLP